MQYRALLVAGTAVLAVIIVATVALLNQHAPRGSDYAEQLSRFKRHSTRPLGVLIRADEPLPEIRDTSEFIAFLNKNYLARQSESQLGTEALEESGNWLDTLPHVLKSLEIDRVRVRPEFVGLTVREINELDRPEFLFLAALNDREISFGDWSMIIYMNDYRRITDDY